MFSEPNRNLPRDCNTSFPSFSWIGSFVEQSVTVTADQGSNSKAKVALEGVLSSFSLHPGSGTQCNVQTKERKKGAVKDFFYRPLSLKISLWMEPGNWPHCESVIDSDCSAF